MRVTHIALLAAVSGVSVASAAWIQTAAGPFAYTDTANWADLNSDTIGDIDGVLNPALSANQTITFGADYTTLTNLSFGQTGGFTMSLRGDGGNRTLTLGGNISVSGSANVGIGNTTAGQNLNLNLGGATRTMDVIASRNLNLNNAVSNGGITKTGAGTLNLLASNTFAGGISVDAGTLRVNSSGALGAAANALTFKNSTTLLLGTANTNTNISVGNGSRTITLDGATTFTANDNDATYTISGLTGAGRLSLKRNSYGTPVFAFDGTNSHAGTTVTSYAKVEWRSAAANGNGDITFNYGVNAPLQLRSDASLTYDASEVKMTSNLTVNVDRLTTAGNAQTLTLKALSRSGGDGNNTLAVTGGNGYRLAVNTLTMTSGGNDKNITISPTSANMTIGTLNTTSGVVFLDGTSSGNEITGEITGSNSVNPFYIGRITKQNTSTWTLKGASNHYGVTTVAAGTLLVNNTSGSGTGNGAVTVSGGILGGTGSIAGAVSVGASGTLNPGVAIESLAVGSATIDGTLKIEINDADALLNDSLAVTGALNITNATLDFDVTGLPQQSVYLFASYGAGQLTGTFNPAKILDLPTGATIDYNYNNQNVIALVIPEPVGVSFIAGVIGIAAMRRRRVA